MIGSIIILFIIVSLVIISTPSIYSQNTELAISKAILAHNENGYYHGEVQTEGHKTLKIDKIGNNQLKAYCIVSYGEFGFENSVFTKISGSGAIPTIIILSKNEFDEYTLSKYEEPEDGESNFKSMLRMFPFYLYPNILKSDKYYSNLLHQQEEYAEQYLISIGREDFVVSGNHIEKTLVTKLGMNVLASNKLLSMFSEYPYWLGTKETIEDGIRYIYCKDYDNDSHLVTFTKKKEDGTTIEKYVIDTTDGELVFLEGIPR